MARFRIDFEGRTPPHGGIDEALEEARRRLAGLWVGDPVTDARVATIEVRISFVLEAGSTQEALAGGHAVLGDVIADSALAGTTWTAARADRVDLDG